MNAILQKLTKPILTQINDVLKNNPFGELIHEFKKEKDELERLKNNCELFVGTKADVKEEGVVQISSKANLRSLKNSQVKIFRGDSTAINRFLLGNGLGNAKAEFKKIDNVNFFGVKVSGVEFPRWNGQCTSTNSSRKAITVDSKIIYVKYDDIP